MTEQFSNPNLFVALGNSTDNKFSFNVATRIQQNISRQLITSGGRAIGGSSNIMLCMLYVEAMLYMMHGQIKLKILYGATLVFAHYLLKMKTILE